MEEIAPGIFGVTSALVARAMTQVVLRGSARSVLVDTGVAETPRDVLAGAIPAPDLIVVSHADVDHCGGNRAALELWPDARIACHELDRAWVSSTAALLAGNYLWYADCGFTVPGATRDFLARELGGDAPVHETLADGDTIDLGGGWSVEVLHLPGHTPGHLGLYDPRSRTAIVMDAVLGRGGPIPPRVYDTRAYRATIERLRALGADRLVTAHVGVLEGARAADYLDVSLAHDVRVEALVRTAPRHLDLAALTHLVDAALGPYHDSPHELAAAVRDHVHRLRADPPATPTYAAWAGGGS